MIVAEATVHTFQSSADIAYNQICKKILDGELAPGQRLTRREMANLTGVSIIPVIEALHRLEDEGLVESVPRVGSRVLLVTDDVIRDRLMLREAIECQVVRILSESITGEQINNLMYMADQLDSTSRETEYSDVFWDRHYRFHATMAEYSNCQSLITGLRKLNLFHILQRQTKSVHAIRHEFPGNWHRRVVEAIQQGDPDNAEKVLREHIERSLIFRKQTQNRRNDKKSKEG